MMHVAGIRAAVLSSLAVAAVSASVFGGELVLAERGRPACAAIALPDDAGPSVKYAAEELRRCIRAMTGVELPVATAAGSPPPGVRRRIVLARTDEFGPDGFRLLVKGGDLTISGGKRGVLYGAYEILETYGGCGWYASWHEVIPKKDLFSVPDGLDDMQKPAFEMRHTSWKDVKFNEDFAVRLRFNGHPGDGRFNLGEKHGGACMRFVERLPVCHTFKNFLPPGKYFKDHPEWFSEVKGVRRDRRTQICLTNPGAFETSFTNICELIEKDREKRRANGTAGREDRLIVGLSQEDWDSHCECAACKAIDDREESHAGSLLYFINRMAERLEARYPGILVETLIYQHTRKPPKTMRPRANVIPCLCSIECSFIAPLERETVPVNVSYMRDLRKWGQLTDNLYIWDYTPDWNHFFYPLPNERVFAPNMRTFLKNGARYLFEEGGPKYADFAQLKAWLIGKFAWNPYQPLEPLLDRFFKGHYGAAAPFLRAYYDRMEALAASNEDKKFTCWENDRPDVFPDSFVEWARDVFRQAEEAVKDDPLLLRNVRIQAFVPLCMRLDRRGAKARWIWVTRDPSKFPAFDDLADDLKRAFDFAEELRPSMKPWSRITLANTPQKSDISWTAWKKMRDFKRPEKGSDSVTLGVRDMHYTSWSFGRFVKDPEAYGGECVEVFNVQDYSPAVSLNFGHVAYDKDRGYVVRFRAKVVKAKGGKGEAFNAEFAGRRIAPDVSEVAEGWNWYEFPRRGLNDAHRFFMKCGRFSHGGGRSAVDAVFIDRLEIVAQPKSEPSCSRAAPVRGPETWLEFMGGNVRKDGLRLDLQAIKDAGISGVQFFHIQRGGAWPECPEQIPCMSEKWEDVVRFLGDECARLGLVLTVQNCPGWSQSGGPWVDLEHCQRDIKMARADFREGDSYRLPEIPAKFKDADSDWRDVCVLAFPTPEGDAPDVFLKPTTVEKDGEARIFRFDSPVTVRSLVLPGIDCWNHSYAYEMPWMRVALDVQTAHGWQEVARSPLPTTNWRDYVETFTLACGEATGSVWRFRFEHDLPIKKYCEPKLSSAPRTTDWEGKSARTLRSLLREPPPKQRGACFVDSSRIVDITGNAAWKVPNGRWTVIRLGHVNAKRVNAPAPKEATGWECDKLDPSGIEANFRGYIGKLNDGVLKGKMRAMLVDSWECFGQTWTPKMEEYFQRANGYALRQWLPALFGWIVGSPERTERFLTDWRRTNGDLITKNYYGHMAELAHAAGLEAYYETAFGDIIYGDVLEYWKYSDAPMCEYWYPHKDRRGGGCCWYTFKPIRPCASAAHIYGKRRVVAEAFTGSGIQWDEDFRKLQDDANRHFARGVTHLAFQSYTHAPAPDALPPGGCMGGFNGTPFTRLQTWWKYMPEFTAWLTRCEEFLEAGLPAQDVLWYLGDAVDHKPDEMYPFPEGFRADYLNHDVLTNRLAVKDGLFTVPEGTSWKVLWVPDERFMLPATRQRLSELAAAGGKVVFGGKDALVDALSGIPKDVATEPALGDEPSEDFMWIHRCVDGHERYFVAAGTNGWRGKVTFRAKGEVSVFDPVSCERTAWRNGDVLEIPPSRSVFVEFGVAGHVAPGAPMSSRELTGWRLSFPSGWGVPEKVSLDRPVSWTEIPGFSREAQAFSGTAAYETEFDCDDAAARCELDLGRVESIAKVAVNGKTVRTLWCEPYRCKLDGFLRKGRNSLRVEVTNTWRNRVIYDLGQPEKDRKTWILYQPRYNPKPTDPFVPSGVLGPVTLKGVE